jgi:hypothetical protein
MSGIAADDMERERLRRRRHPSCRVALLVNVSSAIAATAAADPLTRLGTRVNDVLPDARNRQWRCDAAILEDETHLDISRVVA